MGMHILRDNKAWPWAGWGILMAAGLLGLGACSPAHPDPSPENWFKESTLALRERRYQDALEKVESSLESLPDAKQDQSLDQGHWRWRFRLLKAEILLWMDVRRQTPVPAENDSEIAALLAGPPPTQELELRQLLLKGLQSVSEEDTHLAEVFYRQVHNRAKHLENWNLLTEAEYHLAIIEPDREARLAIYLSAAERPQDQVDPFHLARSYINACVIYSGLENWRLERDWAERALEFSRKSGIKRLVAISLVNLGTAQNRLGYIGGAAKNLTEAQSLAHEIPETVLLSPIFLELGNNDFFQGNSGQALGHYRKALEIAQNLKSELDAAYNQFVALAELGECSNTKQARAQYQGIEVKTPDQASSEGADFWRDILNRGRLEHICGDHPAARESYNQVVAESDHYPFFALRAWAGLGIIEAVEGNWVKAKGYFESAMRLIQEADDAFSRTEDRIAVVSALSQSYGEYVHWLIRHNDHARALEVADSGRGALLREKLVQADVFEGNMDQFRDMSRQASQAFLFYWISKRDNYAWVLKGEVFKSFKLEVNRDSLLDDIRRYKRGIRDEKLPDKMLDNSGFNLSRALIQPVEEMLRGSHVVLILDDELQGLNLETLPLGEPGNWRYWLEDVTVSVAPSLGQLSAKWRQPPPPSRQQDFLLIGDPEYGDSSQDLSGAGREVLEVRSHLSSDFQVRERVGREAHPAAVLQLLKDFPAASGAHFAAHADAVPLQPFESAILLTPQEGRHKLYAYEVLELGPREDLDLVVLSACQTVGENTFSGEGPVGLAWAFMGLGSCNVVASLWDVDDETTADLMDAFYSNWKKDRSYAEALQQAKLHLIREKGWKKPAFWGVFQHYLGCRSQ